tara:strand:- start:3242 stop:4978 length:1737 start_codon:yes stop_codon:yes gene_type:complete
MISLSQLSKLKYFLVFFVIITSTSSLAEEEPIDIWKGNDNTLEQGVESEKNNSKTETPTITEDLKKTVVKIEENEILNQGESVIGIFDPEENNFSLNMWKQTDGIEIKDTLKRISKIKLSKYSEDLLFQILFTNAYAPSKNLNSGEFAKIKINWLIKKKRVEDLEILLKNNPEVSKNQKAIKFLIDEYLSVSDIRSACDSANFIGADIKSNYLEKFKIYCLINDERGEEAQLILDLLKERGFEDKFFEDKFNFLIGLTDQTTQKILDDNLLNFYLSYITNDNFKYEPNDKTDKYIWKYLSSANLMKVNDFEDEKIIITYEEAASQSAIENDEIFKIYLKMNFNFNQLVNAKEIYKNLPNYKARALIYQSMMLSDDIERKLNLAFLLKDLFLKDKIFQVYNEELSNLLKSINPKEIPENYEELVKQNLDKNLTSKIEFDNEILHRSKVIKHFLDESEKKTKTEKELRYVYKKIKKNKKYFISIKDIIVFESLIADGFSLPKGLDYSSLSSELTIPGDLYELANQNKVGLVMLKMVEIIGEDNVRDLDPETIYFLNKILNKLNLKKIRNNILSQALPTRV